jgi:transcriptional regulator with XRE-family HTH domain
MTSQLIEHVAKRIREFCTSYGGGTGISQEALAEALGVASNTISRWETATYRPTIEDLERLARFFGKSILDFFPPEDIRTKRDERIDALLRTAKQLVTRMWRSCAATPNSVVRDTFTPSVLLDGNRRSERNDTTYHYEMCPRWCFRDAGPSTAPNVQPQRPSSRV